MNNATSTPRELQRVLDSFSASKLEMAERCMQAFAFRYLEGRRAPPNAARAMGNAVDATANAVYFEKLQTHTTPPTEDAAARFAAWWDQEASKVPDWQDEKPGELLDAGVASVRQWRDSVAVHVQPVMEPQVHLEWNATSPHPERDAVAGIGSTFAVQGVTDLVAEVPTVDGRRLQTVVDHKASGKAWNAGDVMRSAQPPVYQRATGVGMFQFHVLRQGLKEPRTTIVGLQVPASAADHVVVRMSIARRNIARAWRSGDWTPNRNHVLCSRRWCGFWQECERRHGGMVPA